MKKFVFNESELRFERVKRFPIVKTCLSVYGILITLFLIYGYKSSTNSNFIDYELQTVAFSESDTFNVDSLVSMLKTMNVKYPHIVLAQAIAESNFKSPIFIENHNMFGMRKAYKRPNVQIGVNRNHAVYKHWRMSVIDYALYQCYSLKHINTEETYLQFLDKHYAEAEYYNTIKQLSNECRKYFEN